MYRDMVSEWACYCGKYRKPVYSRNQDFRDV